LEPYAGAVVFRSIPVDKIGYQVKFGRTMSDFCPLVPHPFDGVLPIQSYLPLDGYHIKIGGFAPNGKREIN